jgi:hypothetical protein
VLFLAFISFSLEKGMHFEDEEYRYYYPYPSQIWDDEMKKKVSLHLPNHVEVQQSFPS